MPIIPLNLSVAKAIIESGYMIGDEEWSSPHYESVCDSPYYYIYRPIPSSTKAPSLFEWMFKERSFPEPIHLATIYFKSIPEIYQSRFASDSMWVITVENEEYNEEMEKLASKLQLMFNPTTTRLRRLNL